jgi:PAS domain S-box-containing protein
MDYNRIPPAGLITWVLALGSGLLILSIILLIRNISLRKRAEQALRESERRYQALLANADDAIRTLQSQLPGDDQGSKTFITRQSAQGEVGPTCISSKVFIQTFIKEKRFRSILQHLSDIIWIADENLHVQYETPSSSKTLGYEPGFLIGKYGLDFIHPDDLQTVKQALDEVFREENPFIPTQFRFKHVEGYWVHLEAVANNMLNDPDIQGIIITARDITERKQTEDSLRESEARYRNIVALAPEGIVTVNTKGVVTSCNTAFLELTGFSEEDIVGKYFLQIPTLPTNSLSEYLKFFRAILQGHIPKPIEFQWVHRNGSIRWGEAYVGLTKKGNKITGLQAILIDITERKRAEQLLQSLNQAALAMGKVLKPDEIFAAVAEAFQKLDLSCVLLLMDKSQSYLRAKHLSHEPNIVKTIEKLTGLRLTTFTIPIANVDVFKQVLWKRKTCFIENAEETASQVLPAPLKPLAKQIANTLKSPKVILAPFVVEETPIGLLSVQSHHLNKGDIPAITAFTNQMAAAWYKAQLYEQAQQEIAERERAEIALRESEERFRALVQNSSDIIVLLEADGVVRDISPSVERILGYTAQHFIGQNAFEYVHPDDVAATQNTFAKAIQNPGHPLTFEFRLKNADHTWTYVETVTNNLLNNPSVGGVVINARDITERRRAERLLQTLNAAAQAMQKALTHAEIFQAVAEEFKALDLSCVLFLTDETQRHLFPKYLSYDNALLSLAEKLVGIKTEDFSIDIESVAIYKQIVYERKTIFLVDVETTTRQLLPGFSQKFAGQLVKMLNMGRYIATPLIVEDKILGILAVLSNALTENDTSAIAAFAHQVAAAWRKAQLLNRTREQAQQVQEIIHTVPEGVLLLKTAPAVVGWRVVSANPIAEDYLQILANPQTGNIITHLGERALPELLTSPPRGLWHEITMDKRRFEAIARPIEAGLTPGEWVLVIRDVTQEREIQQRVQQQERLAAVGQLAAGIAHDFNNIMATIVLYAQMLSRTSNLTAHDKEQLSTINQQAMHASNLIQQILDFSRRTAFERSPLDLLPLLKEHVKLLERTLPENIKISLNYKADEYIIHGNPTHIQQVLMNLAVNARDAMPRGGHLHIDLERLSIRDSSKAPLPEMSSGNWVKITVSDTGTGIPADILPHIYDPFFTTKASRQGSGLGLAQVYGIIGSHEGYIDVESYVTEDDDHSRGTTFMIYLPSLTGEAGEITLPITSKLVTGNEETILVVEDNVATRTALVESLQVLNYKVLTAEDGEEALAIIAEYENNLQASQNPPIDLVLSDVVMPKMGGIALLHTLQQQNSNVGVILLTGHPMEKELESLQLQENASGTTCLLGWLLKPPSLEQLAKAIAQGLEQIS